MKTILSMVMLFILISITGYSQGIVQITHQLVKHQCIICGMDIWNCEKIPESHYWSEGDVQYLNEGYLECYRDENQQAITQNAVLQIGNGFVCDVCYKKYIESIQNKLNKEFDAWIEKAKRDNIDLRTIHDKLRKQAEIDDLQRKVKELQYQIDVKEGKIKPIIADSNYWQGYRNRKIYDTIFKSNHLRINTDTALWKH